METWRLGEGVYLNVGLTGDLKDGVQSLGSLSLSIYRSTQFWSGTLSEISSSIVKRAEMMLSSV